MLAGVLAVAISAAASETKTVTTPVGVFSVPEGCRAGTIDWGIDAFMGSIECPKHEVSIFVFGAAGGLSDPCVMSEGGSRLGESPSVVQNSFRLALHDGTPLSVCLKESKGVVVSPGRRLVIGIGPGEAHLHADVRRPDQVVLVLQIISSLTKTTDLGR